MSYVHKFIARPTDADGETIKFTRQAFPKSVKPAKESVSCFYLHIPRNALRQLSLVFVHTWVRTYTSILGVPMYVPVC
jgi:hypothetical protein